MNAQLLVLVIIQAALLLWASIRLAEVFLQRDKGAQLAWFVGTIALPLVIAWWARSNDPEQVLCRLGDCAALAVSVAFVRFWAVSRQQDQFLVEQQIARQVALDKREATRRVQEAERIKLATAALEAIESEKARPETRSPLQQDQVPPGGPGARPPGTHSRPSK
jgi:hypothetical protein